ncbi:MAG: hypothetical protein JWM68_5790 [Verrucomicrobiales bacterium]|nr:hypothetical protein [Verrucomicrobiales bacterium]
MKTYALLFVLLSIALVGCAKKDPAQAKAEQAATESARAWLKLIDDARYSESWDKSAAPFKLKLTPVGWGTMVKPVREPLGKLQKRELISADYMTTIPNAPKGEYVIIQFKTDFENKGGAVETVTPMLEDGVWKVSGYYIK